MTVQEWLGEDNQLGIDIWEKKYRYNNETFDEWLDRVSGGDQNVRRLIKEKKFLFGGRTTANRNTGKKASMMNCYSRGFIEDSLDDIMQANTDIALTFKTQGGQGISLTKLRPKGCGINHGQFKSDGIIPFMELYNRTTESISQGGSRKGALLIGLDIWHKEAEDFIKIKSETGRIEKANLSLEIDDDFMRCVKKYYDTGEIETVHISRDYNGNKIEYDVTPIKLYKLMMEKAYDWAEPGCIFTNRFRNFNLMEYCDDYNIEICNPCGEQPLGKNSACDLGSINLSEFIIDPFTENAKFDFDEFAFAIEVGVRALDDIIDENKDNHALEEQKQMSLNYRNIGLGVMGLYDALCKLGIVYGSEESKEFVDMLMGFMFRTAVISSSKLAKEKHPFPKYTSKVLDSTIIRKHFTEEELQALDICTYGLRNCSLISIAPTGSIGTMLNISTGCEPAFQISYKRKTESLNGKDAYYNVYIDVAKQYMQKYHTESLPKCFITAGDVDWKDRIDLQGIMQNHVDTAISSTINLPHNISLYDIESLYMYAWEQGLKGVTIFRDGCKRTGILTTDKAEEKDVNEDKENGVIASSALPRGYIIKVDNNTIGKERHLQTGCGSLHVCGFFDTVTGDLLEDYISKGSQGGCLSNLIGLSRLISYSARGGCDVGGIVDQLLSVPACPSYVARSVTKHDTSRGACCPNAIGYALLDMYEEMQDELGLKEDQDEESTDEDQFVEPVISKVSQPKCPECGSILIFEGGCNVCKSCGWSKCD